METMLPLPDTQADVRWSSEPGGKSVPLQASGLDVEASNLVRNEAQSRHSSGQTNNPI